MVESVLKIGILPGPRWKNDEKGVILSALCEEGDRRSSVRLPVIRNGKTSEMYVEYEYVTLSYKGSIPMLFGKAVNPIQYTMNCARDLQVHITCICKKEKTQIC